MVNAPYPRPGPATRTAVTCSKCGKATTVPFTPTPGRPVFCRECFSRPMAQSGVPAPPPQRSGTHHPHRPPMGRKRMMAQGRKGHFMHDAKAVLHGMEGGMDDQHIRAFLEGLFARGARASTHDAQVFLDEKLTDKTITSDQRQALGQLVERYSFFR